jgi:hypothetical protein
MAGVAEHVVEQTENITRPSSGRNTDSLKTCSASVHGIRASAAAATMIVPAG